MKDLKMRHSNLRRSGLILLVVLSMLTLFSLLAISYVIFSGQSRSASFGIARRDFHGMRGGEVIDIAMKQIVVEEDLGDRARRTGIDFCLQRVDIGVEIRALRMLLRLGRHDHVDIGVAILDARDEFGGGLVAVRMRDIGRADAGRRVAAQRDDVADADLVILRDDVVHLAARRIHAG